MTTNVNKIYK